MTGITYPSTATNSFSYNAFDQRIGKTDSSGTYIYKRDWLDVTDPVLNDGAAEYTPGVSERRSGASSFYHADRMGSTTKLTNSSQSVTDTRQYDAFGNLESSTGSNPTPFQYDGQYGYQSDGDSGLMLLGHRYYDSSTGRFMSRDPAKDGRNWSVYCESGSVNRGDPSGLDVLALTADQKIEVGAAIQIIMGYGHASEAGELQATLSSGLIQSDDELAGKGVAGETRWATIYIDPGQIPPPLPPGNNPNNVRAQGHLEALINLAGILVHENRHLHHQHFMFLWNAVAHEVDAYTKQILFLLDVKRRGHLPKGTRRAVAAMIRGAFVNLEGYR